MNVITVASRKGGAGKTTLTAHLAVQAQRDGRRVQVIDADPQGSLALCNSLRADALPFATGERGIDRALAMAMVAGAEWVFIEPRRRCGWWCRRRSAPPCWCSFRRGRDFSISRPCARR